MLAVYTRLYSRGVSLCPALRRIQKLRDLPLQPLRNRQESFSEVQHYVNPEDVDLSPRPKPTSSTVTSDATATSDADVTSDAPDSVQPSDPALSFNEQTDSNIADLPTSSQQIEDSKIASASWSEDSQLTHLAAGSDPEFEAEPLVTTEPLGIPDFNDSYTELNMEHDQNSPLIGEISLFIDENGSVRLTPIASTSDNTIQGSDEKLSQTLNVQNCPPEVALAAIECGITSKKKQKYKNSFKLGSYLPIDNCFHTWKTLKSKIVENEKKSC